MKYLFVTTLILFANMSFADVLEQEMPAAQVAVYLSFAQYPNPECVLTNDLNPEDSTKKVTFNLHTAALDVSVSIDPTEQLSYSVNNVTGEQSFKGGGLELHSRDWTTISEIMISGVSCRP